MFLFFLSQLSGKEFISCFLDRNGLRPARIEYFDDDSVSVSSEFGSNIGGLKLLSTDRLGPGGLFMFDRNSREVLKDQRLMQFSLNNSLI